MALAAALLAGCGFGRHTAATTLGRVSVAPGAAVAADPDGGIAGRLSSACSSDLRTAERRSRSRLILIRRLDQRRTSLDRALTRDRRRLKRLESAADTAFRRASARRTAALIARSRAADRAAGDAIDRYNARVDRYNADLHRLDAQIGREHTAQRTYDRGLRRCLMAIPDWGAAARVLEAALIGPAQATGSATPTVTCDAPVVRPPTRYEETGYVTEDSKVIHLSAPTCFGLERVLRDPGAFACARIARRAFENCPVGLSDAVVSIVTLAHEQQHVDGILDEAAAECYALQRVSVAAAAAGVPGDVAGRVALYTHRAIDQPHEYHSAQCRDGGSLDVNVTGEPARWSFP